ncbi:MAG TPA: DinB family protein [Bacteroidota bacterium]|nr:DinB family protein [Bacteroidota bacterium]
MKRAYFILAALSVGAVFCRVANAQAMSHSLAEACERQLGMYEQSIVHVAELMPENRYSFSPESLHLVESDFKGVRTFAAQVKHLASDNYDMWAVLTGETVPPGGVGVEGPPAIKTKAEILTYLKNSFAMGHRAIATLTAENAMDLVTFRNSKLHRLDLAFWGLTHANDHYGQMVVYLRACGITPSATVPQ